MRLISAQAAENARLPRILPMVHETFQFAEGGTWL
jgi:hypothetical protein